MFLLLFASLLLQAEGPQSPMRPETQSQPETESPEKKAPENKVAAVVNGRAITVQDVERELKLSTRGRPIAPVARNPLTASALQKLIDRELVIEHLRDSQLLARKEDVQQVWLTLTKKLEARQIPIDQYLKDRGIRDQEHWRREAAWELSWKAFLAKYLTEENLRKYFERNRQHYDGTEVRVAHIMWRIDARRSVEQARTEAAKVREAVVSKKTTFDTAAKEHSESPTSDMGGDIGFMDRRRTMPESFSKAAFDLQVGEVSQPVVTRFGVHLIRCLEIKQGQKDWNDAQEQLVEDVRQWLFEWAADKTRGEAKIRVTGATASWRDENGHRKLVPPTP